MPDASPRLIRLSDRTVDLPARQVWSEAEVVRLSEREAELLSYLAGRPGQTVTRDALLTEVWGYRAEYQTRAVDTTLRRLRVKVEANPAAPVHLISVFGEGYRFEPMRGGGSARLPSERNSFHGRDGVVQQVIEAAQGGALVTVTGPGGVGKTRLAQRIAAVDDRRDVLWCSLATAETFDDVVRTVALASGLHVDGSRNAQAWSALVGQALGARGPTLLLLDGVERLTDEVGELAAAWLDIAPELAVLITSRARLGVADEHWIALDGLDASAAQALWVERALAAGVPSERVHDPAVPELVRRLDGLPLALELAAVRCRMLGVQQLVDRLDQRFRLLATRDRDVDPRLRSLRASLDASWDPLSPRQQRVLARLGVVPSTMGEALLVQVSDDPDALQVVGELVDVSLVRTDGSSWWMLETVREYALRRLDALGERQQAELLHARWVVPEGDRWCTHLDTPDLHTALARLDQLHPHLAYVARSGGDLDPDLALRAAWYLSIYAQVRGPFSAVAPVLDHAVELGERTGSAWLPRALCARALTLRLMGRLDEAVADARRSLQFVEPGSEFEARCLADLALLLAVAGQNTEAMETYATAIDHLEAVGAHKAAATSRGSYAAARLLGGDRGPETIALFERAIREVHDFGMVRFEAGIRSNYATLLIAHDRLDEARAQLEQGLVTFRALGAMRRSGSVLYNLGVVHGLVGDLDECERVTNEAIEVLRPFGPNRFAALSRLNLAVSALKRHDVVGAGSYLDEASQFMEASGDAHGQMVLTAYRSVGRALAGRCAEASADVAFAQESLRSRGVQDDGLIAMAQAFVWAARARVQQARGESAVELVTRIDEALATTGWGTGARALRPLLVEQRGLLAPETSDQAGAVVATAAAVRQ